MDSDVQSSQIIDSQTAFHPLESHVVSSSQISLALVSKAKLRDWNMREMKILIAAKRWEHERFELQGSNNQRMTTKKKKWDVIAKYVLDAGVTDPVRDADSCKKKWPAIQNDFKKVFDWEDKIPSGAQSYWEMSTAKRRENKLPSNFAEELYRECEDWLPQRAEINLEGCGVRVTDSSKLTSGSSTQTETSIPGQASDPVIFPDITSEPIPEDDFQTEAPMEMNSEVPHDRSIPSTLPHTQSVPQAGEHLNGRVTTGKRKRSVDGSSGKKDKSTVLSEATIKLVDVLKSDGDRKNLYNEEFLKWEREHRKEEIELDRQFKHEQLKVLQDQTSIQAMQAQSFQLLAQAVADLAKRNESC